MRHIPTMWLMIQFMALLTATAVVTGGGQFPGNTARMAVYIKFGFFMLPIIGFVWAAVRQPDFHMVQSAIDFIRKNIWLVLFLLSLMLSIPLSAYPSFSLQRCLYTYLGFGSLFCLLAQFSYIPDDRKPFNLAVACSACLVIVCILLSYSIGYGALRVNVQSTGLIHPNMLGSLMAQLALALILLPATQAQKIVHGLLAIILFIAVIAIQSRGVWIAGLTAATVGLSLNSLFFRSRASLIIVLTALLLACAMVIGFLLIPETANDFVMLFSRGQTLDDMMTLTNRVTLWHALLSALTWKQILVGHGYALMIPDIVVDFGDGILYGAHNAYLSIFLGSGILPLILLLGYWITLFGKAVCLRYRVDRNLILLLITSMVLLLVHSMAGEEFGVHLTPTFMMLVCHVQRVLNRQKT